ncbi:hypothetical protein GC175_17810 [bacterium]|nr:hypothetical protein [bacterium]
MSQRSFLFAAIAPIALYATLVTLYFFAIPLGESPDEPGHVQCIQQVVLYNRLPIVEPKPQGDWWRPGVTLSGRMCYHMPLYYVTVGLLHKSISYVTGTSPTVDFPPLNEAFGETGVMFQHETSGLFVQREESAGLIAVRIASATMGLVTVLATVAVSLRIFPDKPVIAAVAGVWIAGWPQFLFLSRAISNDVLATAFAAVTLFVLLQIGRPQRFVALAILSALALLSKVTMSFVFLSIVLVWLLEFQQFPKCRLRLLKAGTIALLVWGSLAALIHLSPTIHTNFWSSVRAFSSPNERIFQAEYWSEVLRLTLSSGWVRFGWMNVAAPDYTAYIWWAVVLGLSTLGIHHWWKLRLQDRTLTTATLLIWSAANLVAYLNINLAVLQPQFRFLQTLLPIICVFVAGGLLSILPHRLYYPVFIVGVLAVAAVIINLGIIWAVVLPRYALSL